jgi:hypothetical protein
MGTVQSNAAVYLLGSACTDFRWDQRAAAARRGARYVRCVHGETTRDAVTSSGVLGEPWGIDEQLALPRRSISRRLLMEW